MKHLLSRSLATLSVSGLRFHFSGSAPAFFIHYVSLAGRGVERKTTSDFSKEQGCDGRSVLHRSPIDGWHVERGSMFAEWTKTMLPSEYRRKHATRTSPQFNRDRALDLENRAHAPAEQIVR